jgi:hypothetical protein
VALWATIVLQALVTVVYCVTQLAQCYSAISPKGPTDIKKTQCLMPSQVWSFTYAGISMFNLQSSAGTVLHVAGPTNALNL